ncbi:MAG TPA: type II toxin-antitoxin system VapC family toxin [Thiolinea sp.]|nr:type II toxin-antitoxin system VapC family toxin [Thiolinea sp.]
MKYLLDTNICIYLIKEKPHEVLARFTTLKSSQVFISAISVFELYFGVEKSQAPKRNLAALEQFLRPMTVLDFTPKDAKQAAKIRADLQRKGTPIGAYDIQIAATALAQGLTVVTNNTSEFERVVGLKLENWVG